MVSIRFQNPTQGPLITVSFGDSDGPILAFVPAALSSAPADIAATEAAVTTSGAVSAGVASATVIASAAAAGLVVSGDSSPRHLVPELATQPLRGLSRFSSYASAVLPGADADAQAVALPVDPTDTVATDAATPIDWKALLATDHAAFFKLAYDLIDQAKQEVLQRLDRGESPESIIAWLRSKVIPTLDHIEALMIPEQLPRSEFGLKHDLGHKIADLAGIFFQYLLATGDIEQVRDYCRTDYQHMERIIAHLRLTFMGKAIIEKGDGLVTFEIHSPEEAKELLRILENLVRNAADHPRDGKLPIVKMDRDGNRLIVSDDAGGMNEVTVQKLRDGVRIHDGQEVTEGRHGFGWQSIRETSDQLGIQWEIESQPGQGTTVTLTVPDGLFETLPRSNSLPPD